MGEVSVVAGREAKDELPLALDQVKAHDHLGLLLADVEAVEVLPHFGRHLGHDVVDHNQLEAPTVLVDVLMRENELGRDAHAV